jgi:hypothetical protein
MPLENLFHRFLPDLVKRGKVPVAKPTPKEEPDARRQKEFTAAQRAA